MDVGNMMDSTARCEWAVAALSIRCASPWGNWGMRLDANHSWLGIINMHA